MAHLQQFKTLSYVYQHGGVNAAAKFLHLTPSAVSQQIKGLANECGLALMERDGRGIKLTEAGRKVAELGTQITTLWEDSIDQFHNNVEIAGSSKSAIRLGVFPSAMWQSVLPALSSTDELAARIKLFETGPQEGRDLVQAGDLDAAVSIEETCQRDDVRLSSQRLHRDPFVLLGPPDCMVSAANPDVLSRMRWILPRTGSDCDRLITSHLARHGVHVRPVGRTDDWVLAQEMAAALRAIAYIPTSALRRRTDLAMTAQAPGLPAFSRTIVLVTRPPAAANAWCTLLQQRLKRAYLRTTGVAYST